MSGDAGQMAATRLLTQDAGTTPVEHAPVDPADVVDGAPTTGALSLLDVDGLEVGVWEITPGAVTDVEVDEAFVVVSGRGRVELADGSSIQLAPGTVVRLLAGDRTRWIIDETLRKIYVLLPPITTIPTPRKATA